MNEKFSQNFFSSKEQNTIKPREPAKMEEFSRKYSNKAAGGLEHYIKDEIKDVMEEVHGVYVVEDDYSEEDTSTVTDVSPRHK